MKPHDYCTGTKCALLISLWPRREAPDHFLHKIWSCWQLESVPLWGHQCFGTDDSEQWSLTSCHVLAPSEVMNTETSKDTKKEKSKMLHNVSKQATESIRLKLYGAKVPYIQTFHFHWRKAFDDDMARKENEKILPPGRIWDLNLYFVPRKAKTFHRDKTNTDSTSEIQIWLPDEGNHTSSSIAKSIFSILQSIVYFPCIQVGWRFAFEERQRLSAE